MATTAPRNFGSLPWNHERSLEAEAELAHWLSENFDGKSFWTGMGPSVREFFKGKFPLNVFSTPDFIFVPEYGDGSYGPPFYFDVTERTEYSWRDFKYSTILAQVAKVDTLARLGNRAVLAYKWADGVWNFCAAVDVAKNFKTERTPTTIGGEKANQHNYLVPRNLWFDMEELTARMRAVIRNSKPLDYVAILEKMDEARKDDIELLVEALENLFGREKLLELKKYFSTLKPMIPWNSERELTPAYYVFLDALESVLNRGRGASNSRKKHGAQKKQLRKSKRS